jgi:hypothetical protein
LVFYLRCSVTGLVFYLRGSNELIGHTSIGEVIWPVWSLCLGNTIGHVESLSILTGRVNRDWLYYICVCVSV